MNDQLPGSRTIASLDRIRETVRLLAQTPRHGMSSTGAHAAAAQLIAGTLESDGCAVSRQEFAIGAGEGRRGVNVIGELRGADAATPAVLIGAHYDTRP